MLGTISSWSSLLPYNFQLLKLSPTILSKLRVKETAGVKSPSPLRWPDTIYLHIGRLLSIQLSPSAAFDCRDTLDVEKGMLEVYQKRTFIEIDKNLRKFSAISSNAVFKQNAYYWENENKFFLHITLNRCWNLKDFRDQVSNKSAQHNFHSKR